jgi:signal transduction histidine kinase
MSSRSGKGGLRGRLLLNVLVTVAMGVALLTAAFNLILQQRLDTDIGDLLSARAAARLDTLSTVEGRLEVGEAPDVAGVDSPVWIFAGKRVLERPPRAASAVDREAARMVAGGRRTVDIAVPPTQLMATPVRRDGKRLGTVVVGVSEAPYQRTERVALISSLVLAVVLVAIVGFVTRWVLTSSLRPVARMTADAAEWSERDLDKRFDLGPPTDELTGLAATLDDLLDRLSAGMRREQRFSAELSHELRTPLAKISGEAQLLASSPELPPSLREEAQVIVRSAGQMREAIEALMAAARAESEGVSATADLTAAVGAAVEAARPLAAAHGVVLDARDGTRARVTAEHALVERMLAPVLDNACRLARTRASVTIASDGPWARVVIEDDGPGVSPAERDVIFDPGARGEAGRAVDGGAGLGLALARRLARSAGGEIEAQPRAGGGRFIIRLPVA